MSVTTTISSTTTTIHLIKNITVPEDLSWDFFNAIIQSQSNIAMMGITAVGVLAVLFAGSSWIYNFYISKRELNSRIDKIKEEMTTLTKSEIKDGIERIKERTEEILDDEKTYIYGEQARSFAIINRHQKIWNVAVSQWATAITFYATTKNTADVLRESVEGLKEDLDKVMELEDGRIKQIEICLPCIPNILNKERKVIKDKLEKFKQKNRTQENIDLE